MNHQIRQLLTGCFIAWSMVACNSEGSSSTEESQLNTTSPPESGHSQVVEEVVNVQDEGDCVNYLKGRSFTGGNARIAFGHDGTVGAYSVETGELVFGGTLSIGPTYGQASRSMSVVSMVGGERLELLLSSDGQIMDKSSMVIYKSQL